jgi:hypothetical protein
MTYEVDGNNFVISLPAIKNTKDLNATNLQI